jgi:hypothetical protein
MSFANTTSSPRNVVVDKGSQTISLPLIFKRTPAPSATQNFRVVLGKEENATSCEISAVDSFQVQSSLALVAVAFAFAFAFAIAEECDGIDDK